MDTTSAIEALSALAQDTRLAVFRLLVRESGAGVTGVTGVTGGLGIAGVAGGMGIAGGAGISGEDSAAPGPGGGRAAEGLSAGVIAARLKVPPATLSFHLAKLENAGLIKAQRRSLNIFYSPDHNGIRALLGFLTEDCCQGRPELCGVRPPETFQETSP